MTARARRADPLKAGGFALLTVGWFLVMAALQMLKTGPAQGAFIAAGIAVEMLGLALAVRCHLVPKPERKS